MQCRAHPSCGAALAVRPRMAVAGRRRPPAMLAPPVALMVAVAVAPLSPRLAPNKRAARAPLASLLLRSFIDELYRQRTGTCGHAAARFDYSARDAGIQRERKLEQARGT